MGASASTEQSQLQQDIAYLGERMPFGDAELVQVYKVYQKLQEKLKLRDSNEEEAGPSPSFLKDVGVLAFAESRRVRSKVPGEQQPDESVLEERLYLLEAIERKILPKGFGNTLYKTSFLRSRDSSAYDNNYPDTANEEDEYTRMARLEKFFEGLSNGTRRDRKTVTRCLIQCCKQRPPPPEDTNNSNTDPLSPFAYSADTKHSTDNASYIDPMELVDLGYRVCIATAFLKEATGGNATNSDDDQDLGRFLPSEDDRELLPGLQALSNSLASLAVKRKQRIVRSTKPTDDLASLVNEEDVLEWVEQVAPMYGSILPTFLHSIFFPNKPAPPTRSSFDYPRLSQESTVFPTNSSPLLFSFGCMSPSLGGEFYRLYTSASDGLSFNRLQNALLGYGGPTLLIIQSGRSTFGAFTSSPWKESKDFYGNHDCFLFRLLPGTTAVYRPTGGTTKASTRFMYCNSFARSRGFDQQAHGIGFGGSTDQPRLFLSESFDDCRARSDDLTFEKGPLLASSANGESFLNAAANTMFEIDNLEVWGVGGTEVVQESLKARSLSRDIRQANINKARKVDKAAFLDDLRSGVIENKAFAHREQIQGRDGTCELLDD